MEASGAESSKKKSKWSILVLLIGTFILFGTCLATVFGIYIDMAGRETKGMLVNDSNCDGNRTCWTARINFNTDSGEEIAIYPNLDQWPFTFDRYIESGTFSSPARIVNVKYLENSPMFAKVNLAYHIEYVNRLTWFFWGLVVTFIGWVINRNKPLLVLDLSKRNK
ncbi:MAG TPA: hypothetical protein DCX53_12560 [Anaerolineae bacterium]|nr:hypothetical protein [Anaerolineae bacterium]